MGLEFVLTASGEGELRRYSDYRGFLLRMLDRLPDLEKTHCLQYIDPYGDTVFNALQAPVLRREIELLQGKAQSDEECEVLDNLLSLIDDAQKEPHRYLRLVGD